jgi:hypothetical protein
MVLNPQYQGGETVPITSPKPPMADLDCGSLYNNGPPASETPDTPDVSHPETAEVNSTPNSIMLPMELVCLVLDFVDPSDQKTFAAACKVCRQWNFAAQSYLWVHSPQEQ